MILRRIYAIIKLAAQYKGEWFFILSELNSVKLIKKITKDSSKNYKKDNDNSGDSKKNRNNNTEKQNNKNNKNNKRSKNATNNDHKKNKESIKKSKNNQERYKGQPDISLKNKCMYIHKNVCEVIINITKIALIVTILSTIFIFTKYTPAYAVTLNDELIGYVSNKESFGQKIQNEVLTSSNENVAFVALDNVNYKYEFVNTNAINEGSVINTLKENSKSIYKVYEVSNGNEDDAVYVNTEEEAQEIVDKLKSEYNKVTDDLSITTLYLEEEVSDEAIELAKAKINEKLKAEQEEKEKIESRTVNGIYLAVLPVTGGTISSRYGANESVRNHTHKGLDIAASYGTPIKAVADGTVIFSGTESGYGNLIKIDHGNSVTTYYGHCSKLLVSTGANVKAGDVIAKVGSTGNSTGNHLHFEIRINGSYVNPQKYIYN